MKVRLIAMLLFLVTVVSMFAACGPADGAETTTPSQDNSDPGVVAREDLVIFAENGKTDYRIVYPIKSEENIEYARILADTILETTGVEMEIAHDSASGANEFEIRVGDVKGNRMEVLNIYSGFGTLADTDFAIKLDGNTLYLYATSAQGIAAAVDYFMQKVAYIDDVGNLVGIRKDTADVIYKKNDNPAVTITKTDENYVYFSLDAGTILETFCRLSYTGNNGWRIQTKAHAADAFDNRGAAQRLAYSLGEDDPSVLCAITTEQATDSLTVKEADGSYVVINTKDFEMNFYTATGKVASTITNLLANSGGSYIEGKLLEDEAVFGTGERFNTTNQRGKILEMFSADIWSSATSNYVVIPVLCLSRGSGIYINRYEKMIVDLGKTSKNVWSATIEEANVDCYIFTTEQISEVLYGYSDLTGFAEAPEEWSYGMLLCRFSPDLSQKWSADVTWSDETWDSSPDGTTTEDGRGIGVYDVIAKMEEYDLPWTGILAEPWGPNSAAKHEDLKELCDYVHSLGKKFLVYISVGGSLTTKVTGFSSNYWVSRVTPSGEIQYKLPDTQNLDSNNPDNPDGSGRYYLDITNPEATEWFFDVYWDYLSNDIGVDGCKIDFCELMPEDIELNYYDESMATEGSHHWYPSAFCAKFWEMISSKPDSGMCYIRGGGIGLQRSPYVWAGDQRRIYASLGQQLKACLSSGLSGLPFISYDMSGYEYMGGRATADNHKWQIDPGRELAYESQVFIRGFQFTTFTICMQTHGTVRWAYEFAEDGDLVYQKVGTGTNADYEPVLNANGTPVYATLKDENGNEVRDNNGNVVVVKPGTYAYVVDIYRAYIKLHELLTPYITEYSQEACNTAMPVMRHMVLHWQDDETVYSIDDQYMFGDAFLVAPVLDSNFSRDIYLPEGTWKDLNTGKTYTVGAEGMWLKNYRVELTQLPVFYNENTTSETAADLLPGIQEIFAYLAKIEASIPDYIKYARDPQS